MKKENEIWRTVSGYENYYEASDQGNVRSVEREIIDKIGQKRRLKSKILKPGVCSAGYLNVDLSKNGKVKKHTVHRLVALAFLEPDELREQVNHKDGDKLNNHIENLEWTTPKENIRHAIDTGLFNPIRLGKDNPNFKGEIIATCLITCKETSLFGAEDMIRNGFYPGTVCHCISGKLKAHRGHTFKRLNQEKNHEE